MKPAPSFRDPRLDVFRGAALLMIFINHMPGNLFQALTLQRFGFADAAEVFVLLAGIASALAYGAVLDRGGLRACWSAVTARIVKLYAFHLVAFALVLLGALFASWHLADDAFMDTMGLDLVLSEPLLAFFGAVTLIYLPYYLDILPLYIVLLAALPAVLVTAKLRPWLPLAISAAIYALSQSTNINLPNMQAAQVWFFNPFAWQFLFIIGVTIGRAMVQGVPLPRLLKLALTVAAAVYVVFALLVAAPWQAIGPLANVTVLPLGALPFMDKTNLSLFRLADVLAKFWLVAMYLPVGARVLKSVCAWGLSLLGRHSLEVFTSGVVLSLIGSLVLREFSYALPAQVIVTLAGFACMLFLARMLELRRATERRTSGSVALASSVLVSQSPK